MAELNRHTDQTTVYKYDAWGNIAMKWVYSGSNTWTPDSANLIKKYDYVYSSSTDMAWKDLMTEYDGQTITYDEIGNPTSYMGSTMYWEGRTLVEQIKNGTTITYSYDSSDMRTSKTVGGVKHNYYYVQGKLMYEDCPSYKLFYSYDANGFLSGIRKIESGGFIEDFGVHCNIFGDVITIYAEGGNVRANYTYDSWGKILSVTDAYGNDITGTDDICTHNSIRYRGYVYDEETQLYYLQSRYYDPNTSRFINADGMLAATNDFTINLFAYAACNPLVNVDPEGTCPYNGSMGDFRRLEMGLPSMDCDCDKSYVSHVYKTHYTTPKKMLDGGVLFGKIGFSVTGTNQNCTPVIYSFSDLGNDADLYGFGFDLNSWLGVEIGGSTELHIFVKFQVTPYVHAEASVGIDGIGIVLGTDFDNISTDFEIKGGFGTFFYIFAPYVFVGSQPTLVPQSA